LLGYFVQFVLFCDICSSTTCLHFDVVALTCHLLAARGKFLAFNNYLRPEEYLLKGLAPMVSVCEYKDTF
jgi:hypothetical protein